MPRAFVLRQRMYKYCVLMRRYIPRTFDARPGITIFAAATVFWPRNLLITDRYTRACIYMYVYIYESVHAL